jgi:hypothetical protein
MFLGILKVWMPCALRLSALKVVCLAAYEGAKWRGSETRGISWEPNEGASSRQKPECGTNLDRTTASTPRRGEQVQYTNANARRCIMGRCQNPAVRFHDNGIKRWSPFVLLRKKRPGLVEVSRSAPLAKTSQSLPRLLLQVQAMTRPYRDCPCLAPRSQKAQKGWR